MRSLNYKKTFFFKSYARVTDIEIQDGIEIAFIGYSNSGKSSAINILTNQKKLVRSSKTPGRTQLINFFEVISSFRIVDLPGYGYAKAPLLIRKKWEKKLYDYLENRDQIKGFVLLMDIRHPFKILDEKVINIAIKNKISVLVLLNKCDKITKNQQKIKLKIVSEQLYSRLNSFKIELFSSFKKIGIKQLEFQLNYWYNKYMTFDN